MVFIEPSHKILTKISEGGLDEIKLIEKCARYAYRSENKITEDGESAKKMIAMLIKNGHESCLEHSILTVTFTCDRAIANELVRHRLASFTQESTRYVNVTAEKLGANGEMQVILPLEYNMGHDIHKKIESGTSLEDIARSFPCLMFHVINEHDRYLSFQNICLNAESAYNDLIAKRMAPEIARSVLPHSLATKIVMTANYREWRHVFKLRCDNHAHPEMQRIMIPLLHEVQEKIPIVFDDILFY